MEIHKIVIGNYQNEDAEEKLYDYISKKDRIRRKGGSGVYPIERESICMQFGIVREDKEQELERNLFHYIVSFEEWMNVEFVEKRARKISNMIGERYQNYWGIHTNTENAHIHFMINSVSYYDGNILTVEELKKIVRNSGSYGISWMD